MNDSNELSSRFSLWIGIRRKIGKLISYFLYTPSAPFEIDTSKEVTVGFIDKKGWRNDFTPLN